MCVCTHHPFVHMFGGENLIHSFIHLLIYLFNNHLLRISLATYNKGKKISRPLESLSWKKETGSLANNESPVN